MAPPLTQISITPSTAGWFLLFGVLFVGTFGLWWTFLSVIYLVLFICGFLFMVTYVGHHRYPLIMKYTDKNLASPDRGLKQLLDELKKGKHSYKMDKRLTGAKVIDEALQEVLEYFFRDYVHSWYAEISDDEEFLYDLKQTLQRVGITFATRSKDVEWVPFLTTCLVEDLATHLKIYRKAIQKSEKMKKEQAADENGSGIELESIFFEIEHEIENDVCRDEICLNHEREKEYLRDISEILLYLLLPPEDFHNKPFRYFFREIIATCVLLPTVEMVCDPDYINQTIVAWCQDTAFTSEAFLAILSSCATTDELDEVKARVEMEIVKLRSHDSEASDAADMAVKNQLSSLQFLKKLCEAQIRRKKDGEGELPAMSLEPDLTTLIPSYQTLPMIPLSDILENNTALSFFIEFTEGVGGQGYLFFWLAVESYRVTAEQTLAVLAEENLIHKKPDSVKKIKKSNHPSLEMLKQSAMDIYNQYLSSEANPRLMLDKDIVKQTYHNIKNKPVSVDSFDAAQSQSYRILQGDQVYGAFLKSSSYIRCLLDLDLLKDRSEDGDSTSTVDEDDNISLPDIQGSFEEMEEIPAGKLWSPDDDLRLNASISHTGMTKRGSKTYAIYTIMVCRTTSEGTSDWVVHRRYSDFHDLHMHLKDKFGPLPSLNLPGKKTFGNLDKLFVQKRKVSLDNYLQNLLSTELLAANPGMFEVVSHFLELGKYSKEKGELARKMDTIVAPLRDSVHNVSNVIKTGSDGLTDGFKQMSGGMKKMFKSDPQARRRHTSEEFSKLLENLDEDDDNIPLRIMLFLMDEIFDLKHRNQWLRRRIVIMLRQIIKTTFGDRINRKIVDYVDWATSPPQIADYVRMFRDAYWPGGVLAEASAERSQDIKLRTRVAAKTIALGSMSEEIKRFIGSDVTRAGVTRVVNTFQHFSLNKRLLYVLLEGTLETLFPENKFPDIFRKMHAKKPKRKEAAAENS